MIEYLWRYIMSLYNSIPLYIYSILFVAICGGLFMIKCVFGIGNERKKVVFILLVAYIILLLCSTVFFRESSETISGFDFHPFWSYKAYYEGRIQMFPVIIMNMFVFVPVGFLLGITIKNIKWWQVVLTGVVISVLIELLQFFLRRGFSELDDVINNTIGCLIGYGIFVLTKRLLKYGHRFSS